MPPRLSVVILTRNEQANIGPCLDALAAQTDTGFEAILIDAASTDATLDVVRQRELSLPFPLRTVAAEHLMPIGEARNLGVQMAQADLVAFVSADAELEAHWVERALAALADHDMAFGQQVHAPHVWSLGATVRGLRYHFPSTHARDPLVFASNVAAAYRKQVLLDFPFDPWANAAEDLLLARRAAAAGYRATYEPDMVVHHHDVATWRQEMRKNVREGWGCAVYADELGLSRPLLAWAGAMACAAVLTRRRPGAWVLLAGIAWLPTVRRAVRRRGKIPTAPLVVAVAASPVFDLAFLAQYLRGLRARSKEVTA